MYMIGEVIPCLPVDINNIQKIKLENGIYDDFYATHINEAIKESNNFVVSDVWDEETYLHAKFNGTLYSGNADFGVENTTNIIVKRRKKGTYKWFPIIALDANDSDDYNFVVVDKYATSGVTYEYAVVPIINGVEGEYSIAECSVKFDDLVIIDRDETYSTLFDIEVNQQKNNTSSTILPIGSKYPIYVANAKNDYYTGSISATFLDWSNINGEMVFSDPVEYREKVLDFLNNRKVKFIKEPLGRCWIGIIGNAISDEDDGHHYKHKISFDFTEVGNIESNEDMNKFGFLDIGEEWWI